QVKCFFFSQQQQLPLCTDPVGNVQPTEPYIRDLMASLHSKDKGGSKVQLQHLKWNCHQGGLTIWKLGHCPRARG
ncbi:unnamed protein product, partial [Staurois parvus]